MTSWSEYDKKQGCERKLSLSTFSKTSVISSSNGKRRKVTDPLVGLFLVGCWSIFVYLFLDTINEGDLDRVLYGTDYKGRLCGKDVDGSGNMLPRNWYPVDIAGSGICIDTCPSVTSYNETDLICKDESDIFNLSGCLGENGVITNDPDLLVLCGGCMYQLLSLDVPILHYCVPERISEAEQYVNNVASQVGFEPEALYIGDAFNFLMRFVNDLIINWKLILGIGVGGSSLLGFLFLLMLRMPGFLACSIWLGTLMVPVMFGCAGYYCNYLAGGWNGRSDEEGALRAASYFLYIFAAISMFLVIYLRRRIQISIGIAQAAARAVLDFPSTMLYPFLQIIGFVCLLAFWIPTLLFLASMGQTQEETAEIYGFQLSYLTFNYSEETIYWFWFLLFVFFWTSEFIIALGQITLSLCFSKWYFSENKRELPDIVSLFSFVWMAFAKHFGTAAFGALFISVLQMARFVLIRIQEKLNRCGAGNKISDMAFCSCQCCIFVLERWLKFLSKNAYIETAIFGFPYCRASREAYYLINRHSELMGTCGLVSDVSLLFGKMFVILGCAMVSFLFMDETFRDIYSPVTITVAIGIVAYFIIDMFADVLDMAMCTILLCFIADDEMNGNAGSKYVPIELVTFIKSIDRVGS